MNNNIRTLIACFLSLFVLIAWQYFFPAENLIKHSDNKEAQEVKEDTKVIEKSSALEEQDELKLREDIIVSEYDADKRVMINNKYITGSINLIGARIDDITLSHYKQTIKKDSTDVLLLSPSSTEHVYFAEFGWISPDATLELPNKNTIWTADKKELKPNNPVTLQWVNAQGVIFEVKFKLDYRYMFSVEQNVSNLPKKITMNSYALINRAEGSARSDFIIHEGAIGVFDEKLQEISYKDIRKKGDIRYNTKKGWVGFSDKYWLVSIIPEHSAGFDARLAKFDTSLGIRYQTDAVLKLKKNSKDVYTSKYKLFAGAKKIDLLDYYENKYDIYLFDRAVDFGVLYFITKPIFIALNYFHSLVGNFGIAILLLTVVIKILLFPLAFKGFKGMNRLKDLQPQMAKLKESYGDDPATFQKELMALYKKEKVNPISGCLPLLLQMPIFFALYKVLYVTIEMRHAYFFGWIKDLSAPDPTTIFNLFGLIPWQPPGFLMIGVLPIIMAITLFVQQKLNPEPTDPMQAKVMKMLPIIFVFMFASFPSGLVLYWSWSNVLSITQQIFIKRLTRRA